MTTLETEQAIEWGPIGREVYERTYARPKPDGTLETWPETVQRVVDGNLALAPYHAIAPDERECLIELFTSFKALPAGRHLWASGAETTLGLFNCHRAGWDKTLEAHFLFTFDQLMLGGGVGANYSSEYLDKLPRISNPVRLEMQLSTGHPDYEECVATGALSSSYVLPAYVVEDSREGWTKALELVIRSHTFYRDAAIQHSVVLDMSNVRSRGSEIRGFGGIASGPGPLISMLASVNETLNGLVGEHLTPLAAMDIDHEIAACVISGNVRRSARMSILHWADPSIREFLACKEDASKHWTTNISVEVDEGFFSAVEAGDPEALELLEDVAARMRENGEPGFYNSSLASVGELGDVRSTNPCGEIGLEEWEQCCLGHVNLAAFHDDLRGALEAFRLMTRYLLRATLAASSDVRQEAVKASNRRIGVGFFGFHDWALLQGIPYSSIPSSITLRALLSSYRTAVDTEAIIYARSLGIPVPIKTTTVAPTGSVAKLPGVSEGIQPPFSPYFVRRVRYAANDPKLERFRAEGYLVEPDIYSPNTEVVSFLCRDEILDKVPGELVKGSNEIPVRAYLELQAFVQEQYANNAISITANFERQNLSHEELVDLLKEFLPRVKGLTLMPEDGRPQSPYERISRDVYEQDLHHLVGQAFEDCSTGACPIR